MCKDGAIQMHKRRSYNIPFHYWEISSLGRSSITSSNYNASIPESFQCVLDIIPMVKKQILFTGWITVEMKAEALKSQAILRMYRYCGAVHSDWCWIYFTASYAMHFEAWNTIYFQVEGCHNIKASPTSMVQAPKDKNRWTCPAALAELAFAVVFELVPFISTSVYLICEPSFLVSGRKKKKTLTQSWPNQRHSRFRSQ